MARPTHPSRANEVARRLLPAVALVFGLGWRGEAPASAVSPAPAFTFDVDDHAQHCKCRSCSGESCCCSPRRARPVADRAAAKAEPVRPGYGPCLSASPCDDAGLPDTPVPGPSGKVASLATLPHRSPLAADRLVLPGGRCILPPRRASRLDEPPERSDLA